MTLFIPSTESASCPGVCKSESHFWVMYRRTGWEPRFRDSLAPLSARETFVLRGSNNFSIYREPCSAVMANHRDPPNSHRSRPRFIALENSIDERCDGGTLGKHKQTADQQQGEDDG